MYVATIAAGAISRINSSVTALESRVDGIAVLYVPPQYGWRWNVRGSHKAHDRVDHQQKKVGEWNKFWQKVNLKGSIKEIGWFDTFSWTKEGFYVHMCVCEFYI